MAVAVAVAGYNGMWGGDQDDQTQAPALSLSLSLSVTRHKKSPTHLLGFARLYSQFSAKKKYSQI